MPCTLARLVRCMRIRTVLDARPDVPRRHQLQTLLLAHSWAASSTGAALDVVVIGDLPDSVKARLRELGVTLLTSPPHRHDSLGRNTNKLVALRQPSDAPVLLVDNDICFLEDVSDLSGRNVCASLAGTARLTGEQWTHIEQSTGLRPLTWEWVPMREQLEAARAGREPTVEHRLYVSGGVVWIRRAPEFEATWDAHIDAIARVFDGHPASTKRVRGSDQAGLATAVAATGGFDLLPFAYNYRPMCFRLGLTEQPKILHLNKLGEDEQLPFSKSLTRLWSERMLRWIKRDRGKISGPQESESLLDQAISIRDRVLRIGTDADLDAFAF